MKRKRHTEDQIIAIPKEAENGLSTAEMGPKHGDFLPLEVEGRAWSCQMRSVSSSLRTRTGY